MRGRFAPSPTGRLHLGNARSALLGWLQARAAKGAFLLRIEDLDAARCRPEHLDCLFRDLEYLGLDWDAPPLFQSHRTEAYDAVLERLRQRGQVYPCICTRGEIARAASAPHGASDEGPRYPGTCFGRAADEISAGSKHRPPALRFRPHPGIVAFDDLVRGHFEQDVDQVVGDFVVRRNDGVASYQLAVVVDDAETGVTHVLRGDDLLTSTPRQIRLLEALDLPRPAYAHVPLLMGSDGKRLAKREGPFAVAELREAKVPPEKVLGVLALWSGLGTGEPLHARDLVDGFSIDRVRTSPVRTSEADVRALLGLNH